jgi:hypothetical protein
VCLRFHVGLQRQRFGPLAGADQEANTDCLAVTVRDAVV